MSGRTARTAATSSERSRGVTSTSPSGTPSRRCEARPRTEAASATSSARVAARAAGSAAGSMEPLSPWHTTTRWASQPARAQRARVPPQATSTSSGWA